MHKTRPPQRIFPLSSKTCNSPHVGGGVRRRLSESLRAFRSVFANAGLRRLELAWALSETGKWLYIVALAVFAYDIGGTEAVGVVALIRVFPSALLAPFAGLVADRYRREHVMLGASVLRALLFGLAACEKGPAEKAGERIDRAAKDARDAVRK